VDTKWNAKTKRRLAASVCAIINSTDTHHDSLKAYPGPLYAGLTFECNRVPSASIQKICGSYAFTEGWAPLFAKYKMMVEEGFWWKRQCHRSQASHCQ
jgi:hypothetical protein